jgi:hypothetical protein
VIENRTYESESECVRISEVSSRRAFLGSLGAFALLSIARIEPEPILYNGNICTVNDKMPRAQAIAIEGRHVQSAGRSRM